MNNSLLSDCKKGMLSLVVPCYNEEDALPHFYPEVVQSVADIDGVSAIEFIFVDDGSCDGTLSEMRKLADLDARVHYISFSRNFGKEAAIYAGLEQADGEWIAVLDADLQDPPALIPEMLRAVREEEYDCAGSRRVSRKGEPPIRSWFARMFYKIMRRISDIEIVDGARDFRLMTCAYKNAILSVRERNRFSKGIFPWVGFKVKWFEYENIKRVAGESKWSFWKLFKYSLDGFTAFSTKPLSIASLTGCLLSFGSLMAIVFIVIRKLIYGDPVQGWASTICVILFCSGIQLLALGIIGQYLAKAYLEIKARPLYIVKEMR